MIRTVEELIADLERENDAEPTPLEIVNGARRAVDGSFMQLPDRKFHADGRGKVDYERVHKLADIAAKVLSVARDGDLLMSMAAVRQLTWYVDDLEHEIVAVARCANWSWVAIGRVLHVHPSAVPKRFARKDVRWRDQRRRRSLSENG